MLFTTIAARPVAAPGFRDEQLLHPRVQAAYHDAWPALRSLLRAHAIEPSQLEVFFRVFKVGTRLEVWARNRTDASFQLLKTYPLAGTSGTLGPKRREGDGQVPEGFYRIDRFNPESLYHLSLGLDYPNAADRLLGSAKPGGDIFIHGSNVTIGCLPITDAGIREVYVLATEARHAGQTDLQVHIFPFELTDEQLQRRRGSVHYAFWQSLAAGYRQFAKHHTLPTVQVEPGGAYVVR
ncbi:L,D-transpeptidase family protein [Hymenobacter busanensis]|uniref:L,D-transpeptidase family protein n=1 Tax=Hymenobacter busanensis TaxID=2607656 RepID=UPI001243AABA|nr:L,D-transpeptidase family protein [Hymenobacter busanensis]